MKIKHRNYKGTNLNRFDLLGYDETALSKAFAYLLASEASIFYKFVRSLGISTKNTASNFRAVTIEIEQKLKMGRTDIDIRHAGKFHIIIECKIGTNRIRDQRTKYLHGFKDEPKKILCFITQERDCNREISAGIDIHYKGWLDIISLISQNEFTRSDIIKEFSSYATKGFKMRDQKEVLIQDLSKSDEIRRYKDNFIYCRDATFGSPLYFAPYFTRAAPNEVEGITYLSKVLGVLTIKPKDVKSFEDELSVFANNDKSLVKKWLAGIKQENIDVPSTYYFLASPIKLKKPLMKDQGKSKGRGKGWIAAMIPKNRCVTFEEFARRMVLTESNN